jgi:hypothetical protein
MFIEVLKEYLPGPQDDICSRLEVADFLHPTDWLKVDQNDNE